MNLQLRWMFFALMTVSALSLASGNDSNVDNEQKKNATAPKQDGEKETSSGENLMRSTTIFCGNKDNGIFDYLRFLPIKRMSSSSGSAESASSAKVLDGEDSEGEGKDTNDRCNEDHKPKED